MALIAIDPSRVRLHVCWDNHEGPHTHDVPFDDIQPLLYRADVDGIVLSMANARQLPEYRCFERQPVPDDWVLIAGVIDTTSNYVEHPEVVADRLTAITNVIGDRRRIVAGTDCGFRHLGRHRRRCSVCGLGETTSRSPPARRLL